MSKKVDPSEEPAEAIEDAADTVENTDVGAPRPKSARRPVARPAPVEEHGTASLGRTIATVVGTLLIIAVVALSVVVYLQHRSADRTSQAAADTAHAEQVAMDYAVSAGTVNYNDLTPWLNAMKHGVTSELSTKYDAIANQMQQIVVPLRMVATATPVVAKVTSETGGIYTVKAVVDVSAQSAQAPSGTLTTTAYTITLDRNQNWLITQVGDPASGTAALPTTTSSAPTADASGAPATPTVPAMPGESATPTVAAPGAPAVTTQAVPAPTVAPAP